MLLLLFAAAAAASNTHADKIRGNYNLPSVPMASNSIPPSYIGNEEKKHTRTYNTYDA